MTVAKFFCLQLLSKFNDVFLKSLPCVVGNLAFNGGERELCIRAQI